MLSRKTSESRADITAFHSTVEDKKEGDKDKDKEAEAPASAAKKP